MFTHRQLSTVSSHNKKESVNTNKYMCINKPVNSSIMLSIHRHMLWLAAAGNLVLASFAGRSQAENSQSISVKPHIIMHLVDDWGWANAGWHSKDNPEVVTPNMNSLVLNGVELCVY